MSFTGLKEVEVTCNESVSGDDCTYSFGADLTGVFVFATKVHKTGS